MEAVDGFKYFGLYSILLFTLVTVLITYKWHEDHSLTLSRHIALRRTPYYLFLATSIIGQIMFWLFVVFWLVPFYGLNSAVAWLITLGSVCQLTAATIPDTGEGTKSRVHSLAAWTMAAVMYLFVLLMCLEPSISAFARWFCGFGFVWMTTSLAVYFFSKRHRDKTFILQNAYILVFYSAVLIVAYL